MFTSLLVIALEEARRLEEERMRRAMEEEAERLRRLRQAEEEERQRLLQEEQDRLRRLREQEEEERRQKELEEEMRRQRELQEAARRSTMFLMIGMKCSMLDLSNITLLSIIDNES